jgi:hypothetical protein
MTDSLTEDTFPQWLYQRFNPTGIPWENLHPGEQLYWQHEAAAVRRAVERGGFKQDPQPSGGRGMFDFGRKGDNDRND